MIVVGKGCTLLRLIYLILELWFPQEFGTAKQDALRRDLTINRYGAGVKFVLSSFSSLFLSAVQITRAVVIKLRFVNKIYLCGLAAFSTTSTRVLWTT